ncbi:hypothetical protein [Alienimonas chondri]|uniref:hypothetical protein n=1 Tax=Alienimonas chondri TaxID=2681879 RepID=UPI001487D8B7|nr:hypothetical protein [Alienimonas chondri]
METLLPQQFAAGPPPWFWIVAAIACAPGVAGLLLSFYCAVRYPYLSLATADAPREIRTGQGIFIPLGWTISLLGLILVWIVAMNFEWPPRAEALKAAVLIYVAVLLFVVGFLLANYRPKKHPTVASWLMMTGGLGVLLGPLYLPFLFAGSRRLKRIRLGSTPLAGNRSG